ncbi:RagB/SusD family nutrient uptake outer membrane protein [Flavitalea sp. BT771]|uniref:RagB/SusD family nutrient uptake outer membrane protein n=1 Tax=Flavitalea sp. BT771 TaxID=3063329 RepID=UPI0026E29F28|nr:RagB/SusD family nutrient uptake outer membrane protein [Flavitalea sp. BT771]MDO6432787.1 RagB/SusD family nutrient uptake outer membrane protein [Flavitalea sp. BT771]MDV6221937.1 RagB/SusD family nutrient uptake outer membrane protein [Flavitalea sp. BT771]
MKHYKIFFGMLVLAAASCTKLDVDVKSRYTSGNFPNNSSSYAAMMGAVYGQLANSTLGDSKYWMNGSGYSYGVDYWLFQELCTDEAIIPARDGNYDDGGKYRFMHLHTWTKDHPYVISTWQWGFTGINLANQAINVLNSPNAGATAGTSIAQMKAMKGLFTFLMMDLYGNIPILDTFPQVTQPATRPRAEVFDYIERTMKSALPGLPANVDGNSYGKPTKWMAFALLEKLYLNAQYYVGTDRNADAVAMADSILSNAPYTLDANYNDVFAPTNGPQVKETILAIPYDANSIPGDHFERFGLHACFVKKYSIPFGPSVALSTIPDFHAYFNLNNDVRNATWLSGPQYNWDGSPLLYATTKKALDATYTGPDGPVNWPVVVSDTLKLKPGFPDKLDVGNDVLGQLMGARSIKYYPDPNANPSSRFASNDIPVFRLADVILMKAEAILRGAAATTVKGELQTPDVLVNKIRTRAHADPVSNVDLQGVLDERARELAWEGWRRNDLIRYGQFENKWGFKTDANVLKRVMPVPATEIALNPKLVQNEGY